MTDTISFEVPGPPVAKGRGRVGRLANGRPTVFTPAQTRSYEDRLRGAAVQAMRGRDLLYGAVEVTLEVRLPVPESWLSSTKRLALAGEVWPTKRPDLDNYIKTLDALNGVVWRDDSAVVRIVANKVYSERPALAITVRPA